MTYVPPQAWTGRVDSEDGPTARRLHQLVTPRAKRALLGFACDAGVRRNQGRTGASEGPAALRTALAILAAPAGARAFRDLGDISVADNLETGQEELAQSLHDHLPEHDRILVIGGGHETAFGSFMGLRRRYPDARIGILNLDAHLDLRALGPRGASSGTPFFQIRELDPARFDYLCVGVAREANTEALLERAHDWNVGIVFDEDCIARADAADAAVHALAARNDILYLTICLDALPHFQAPGVSAPAARGVPLAFVERLAKLCLGLAASGSIRMPLCDLVELCPPHDPQGVTARAAALLARRLLLE